MPDRSVKRAHPKRVAGALAVTIDKAEEKLHKKTSSRHSGKSSSSSSKRRSVVESGESTPASIPASPSLNSPLGWSSHAYSGAEPSPITPCYSSGFSPQAHGSHDNVRQYAYAPPRQAGASNNVPPGSALGRLEFQEHALYSDAGFREEAERREKLRWLSSTSGNKASETPKRTDRRPESPSWQPSFDTDVSTASHRSDHTRPLALRARDKDEKISHRHTPSSSKSSLSERRSSKRSQRSHHSGSTSSQSSTLQHSDSDESLPKIVVDADSQLKTSMAGLRLNDDEHHSRHSSRHRHSETRERESQPSKHRSATTPTRPGPPKKHDTALRVPLLQTNTASQERSHKHSGAGSSSESTTVESTRRPFNRRMSGVYADSERRCSLSPTLVRTNSRIMFTVEERSPAAFNISNPMDSYDSGARTPPDTPITPCAGDDVAEVQIAWCPDSRPFHLKHSSRRT